MLPAQDAIESADRWLAERASGAADAGSRSSRPSSRPGPTLEKVYREIERPLTPVLARMELAGIAIDAPFLNEMSARMEKDLRALEQKIWEEAGEEFNVNSPVQLGHDPLREARAARAEEDGEDEVLLDRRRGPERARGAGPSRCPSASSSTARSRS